MRRLRLSDDASSSPSSADLEPELPRRPLTDRPSSRLGSTSQASLVPLQLHSLQPSCMLRLSVYSPVLCLGS